MKREQPLLVAVCGLCALSLLLNFVTLLRIHPPPADYSADFAAIKESLDKATEERRLLRAKLDDTTTAFAGLVDRNIESQQRMSEKLVDSRRADLEVTEAVKGLADSLRADMASQHKAVLESLITILQAVTSR